MIVMKFGGSSLESAEAIDRVAGIVAARAGRRPLVVVSAMGETTDHLLAAGRAAASGNLAEALKQLEDLREYHHREAKPVTLSESHADLESFLDGHFHELSELLHGLSILGEITPRSIDAILSYGERLSSYIITLALRQKGLDSVHVDSRQVMVTNERFAGASPLFAETNARLREHVAPLIAQGKVVGMGGFIASTKDGITSTLGRGGSDYTASIVGAGLDAEEIQIWTDVDGIMTADPSIISGAYRLRVLSFAEAAELAYFGARVLHPSTLVPAIKHDIPVRVLNSRRPELEGTLIVAENPSNGFVVKSIAYKENITVVDIRSTRMLLAHGFLAKIFEIFDRYETAVDMVSTSEVSVSLTIDRTERLAEITRELEEFAEVRPAPGQVIVCVVGDNIRHTPGVAGRLFQALGNGNLRMISQGASRLNVSFVISENDLHPTVQALHQTFFSHISREVFA
jgi:aspartate kinase